MLVYLPDKTPAENIGVERKLRHAAEITRIGLRRITHPPLGYDVRDRKLVVNEVEAATVSAEQDTDRCQLDEGE